jgi:DNA polymerase III delta subunit
MSRDYTETLLRSVLNLRTEPTFLIFNSSLYIIYFMLIYLYGADSYRRAQKQKELAKQYKEKNPGSKPVSFSLNEADAFQKLDSFIHDQSLFKETKLGIVTDVEKEAKAARLLKKVLADKTTTIILISEKKLGNGFPYLYRKPTLSQLFEPLKGQQLVAFINAEANIRNIKLSQDDITALLNISSGDLWTIVNELEKLSLGGSLTSTHETPQFFPLIQALKNKGDVTRRLSALEYLLMNEDPAAVFNITAAIASPDQKEKMADLDLAIKSGKLEYEEALLDFVLTN